MKKLAVGMMAVVVGLVGCATPRCGAPSTRADRAVGAIRDLYDLTRTIAVVDGMDQYQLIPDARVVAAAETLLLEYSRSQEDEIRLAAARCLAHFGTAAALERAIELARVERDPMDRAELWAAIAELLPCPIRWPAPKVGPIGSRNPAETDRAIIPEPLLSPPEFRVIIHTGSRPKDMLRPPDIPLEAIEDELIACYETDDGAWPIRVIDRIPYVPFWSREHTYTMTVRSILADTLMWSAQGRTRILVAFQRFSAHPDAAIHEPARTVVRLLSRCETPEAPSPPEGARR